jgi:hypothetical protein
VREALATIDTANWSHKKIFADDLKLAQQA